MDACAARHPAHLDVIEAIFDLLETNRDLRLAFARLRFQRINPPRLDIAPLQWALAAGLNISYAKVWADDGQLLNLRVIFAVDESAHCRRLLILGLMPRGDDYDKQSVFGQRIVRDYDRFRFPRGQAGGH